MARVLRILN